MKQLFIIASLVLWGLSSNSYAAPTPKKVKVPCPAIIANPKTKEYAKKSSYVCYSTAAAAKKAGYVETSTTANALPTATPTPQVCPVITPAPTPTAQSCPVSTPSVCIAPTPTASPKAPVDLISISVLDAVGLAEVREGIGSSRTYPQSGNTFVAYLVRVDNPTSFSISSSELLSSFFRLVTVDRFEFKGLAALKLLLPGNRVAWNTDAIPPNDYRQGWVVYEIPNSSVPSQLGMLVSATGSSSPSKVKYVTVP